MTWIESIAVVFGLLCVWLTVRQNIWCWPTGLIQVVLYVVIFYRVKLYADLILHVIYVILQIYGWYHWLHGGKDHGRLLASRLRCRSFAGWIFVLTMGTALWGWNMATFTDAAVPYWDAFITTGSLIAQWLMTRKRLESWWFWISVDIVAIGIYLYKSLFMTSGLYAVFLIMAIIGFFTWRKTLSLVSNEDRINAG